MSDPRSRSGIAELVKGAAVALPDAYLRTLAENDGWEGELTVEPGWIVLWPAAEVLDLNREFGLAEFVPGLFGIGSNGAGEMIALDTRGVQPWPVVMVPLASLVLDDVLVVASSFESLIAQCIR